MRAAKSEPDDFAGIGQDQGVQVRRGAAIESIVVTDVSAIPVSLAPSQGLGNMISRVKLVVVEGPLSGSPRDDTIASPLSANLSTG